MADELPQEYWVTTACASTTHVIKTAECPWCTIERLLSTLAYRLQELDDAKWLIRNGEKHFGSLWRDATAEDINAVTRRAPPQPSPTFCEHVRCNLCSPEPQPGEQTAAGPESV